MTAESLATTVVDSTTAGKMCSICQTGLVAGETIVLCPHCGLPFHEECWQENRGCAQYGCKSAPETIKPDAVVEFQNTVWGTEKPCPQCGEMIKAKAQKCRFCGAMFEDRGFISKEKYATREYAGKEYDTTRNKMFAIFLMSATGLLAPITLVILSILYFNKSCMGIDYRRLPSSLKMMAFVAMGVDVFLLLIFFLLVIFD